MGMSAVANREGTEDAQDPVVRRGESTSIVAGARNHRNRLALPSRQTQSDLRPRRIWFLRPQLTALRGNGAGTDVGIWWEYGNRTRFARRQRPFVDENLQTLQRCRHPLIARSVESSRTVVTSIGPITTAALQEHGVEPDLHPGHPKIGLLLAEVARRQATELIERKRYR